ncbi:Crp/Fnr family transcriptional regulator [Blautia sp.]|jgi:CRP/FNR family cyclic AMP-dependent transcriptional regulator|uniref:Crp/Fnr family transcriptional regulator n=1 Tax=Blautia sp. TaxID=1955243 RepID=UPI003D8DB686
MSDYLYNAISVLGEIEPEKYEELKAYFAGAPMWLIDSFQIIKMEKDYTFIRENEPVKYIYLIIKGIIRAADYRIYGIVYDFMRVNTLEAMGGMELVLDLPAYTATIETVTPCIAIKIPKHSYEKWLNTDINALKREAKTVGRYLLETDRKSRAYLFLQGADRLALYLVDTYKKNEKNGRFFVNSSRAELSEMTGLCVRTVNRAVKKFHENGWITKEGNKFSINKEQYMKMNEMVSALIER